MTVPFFSFDAITMKKTLSLFIIILLLSSCATKNDPLQKPFTEELTEEELAQINETDSLLPKKCRAAYGMAVMSGAVNDSTFRVITYKRFTDFLDYKPDTSVIYPKARQEWNAMYAEMDTLDSAYIPLPLYCVRQREADLRSYDSLSAEVLFRVLSHVKIVRPH